MRKLWGKVWNTFHLDKLSDFFSSFSELLPAFFLFCQAEPFGKNKSISQSAKICCDHAKASCFREKNHPDETLCSRMYINKSCREYNLKGVFSSFLPSSPPPFVASRCSLEESVCKLRCSQAQSFLKALLLFYFCFEVRWNSPGILTS